MKTNSTLPTALLLASLAGLASAQTEVPVHPSPHFIASPADLKARIATQLRITKPDFVVFVPEVADDGASDTGNEHFLVFDGPDGSLMAVWTQSSVENFSPDTPPDQHIAFSQSKDEGKTWSKPRILAGPKKAGEGHMASWAYPLVSRQGRIYVLYSQSIGRHDSFVHHTAWLHGICSDDNGATWSQPQNVPVARSIHDNPDPTMPPNMLCWQKPLRLGKDGKYFAGFTRWTSFEVREPVPLKNLGSADSRVEFMRFENVDANPEPRDLEISWFMANDKALAVPHPKVPQNSVCQEPSIVKLPDGRLFCVMRTAAGSPFWSVSADLGETWTEPRRLLRQDGGEPLRHPISPCPIYDVGGNETGSGRYVLFIHDNDGNFQGYRPNPPVTGFNRRPVYLVAGRFQPGADQPVWFGDLQFFMDHDNTSLGKPGTSGRMDLSLYSSFTVRNGKAVLWYPDRKFFLLGRVVGDEATRRASNERSASGQPAPASPVTHRFVAIDNVCAWPNLTPLRDGTIIAAIFNQPTHGGWEGDVECWASRDGQLWEKRGTPAPHEPETNRMNVAAGLARDGHLLVLASGWDKRPGPGTYRKPQEGKPLPVWICRSSDGGSTWTRGESPVPPPPGHPGPVIPFGDIVQLAEGTLGVCLYGGNRSNFYISSDDGRTWAFRGIVRDQDINETTPVVLPGERLLAAGRTREDPHLDLFASDDQGVTWEFQDAVTGKGQIPADLTLLADGRLLLTYGSRVPGQLGVEARISADRGVTWSAPIPLVSDISGDIGYPSNVQLPGGEIVTAYYARHVASHHRYHMGVAIWTLPQGTR